MTRTAATIVRLVPLLLLLLGGAAKAGQDTQSFDAIERGRYLALASDCAPCHTAPGGKLYAGGLALETPFGRLVSPNITPDRETGIGAWSDDEFVAALQDGRGRGGFHLFPAMPYPNYTKLSRDDALAIRAFLDTLEPVRNEIDPDQLPFPYNIRASLRLWNALFFTPGRFSPAAGKSAEWNRGAFLVEGPGHCGVCHTPKNPMGGDETRRGLQGAVLLGWLAPNLTGDVRGGVGSWSVEDVVQYLRTGHNRVSAATGPMAEVVTNSTSQLSEADLSAIAVYLKDQPGAAPSAPRAADVGTMTEGKAIYVDNCSACHDGSGSGVGGLFPTLKQSPSVQSADATTLVRVVLQGAQSVATSGAPTGAAMPALGWKLDDAQVAAVLTYIRNSWGNAADPVSAGVVAKARRALEQ